MEERINPAPVCYEHVFTTEHVDMFDVNYLEGEWELSLHDETNDREVSPSKGIALAGPQAQTTRPAGSEWDFLGVGSGVTLWVIPQTVNPQLPLLGFSNEETPPGTFLSYFENDPRVNTMGSWLKVSLQDVRGPGDFSLYQIDSFGDPINWMATADGITTQDAFFFPEGAHADANWAFTAKGIYEIDAVVSAFLADGTPTTSDLVTIFISVDTAVQECQPIIVTGTDAGFSTTVKVFNAETQAEIASFSPYASGFLGGARVAAGDVNGDNAPDIITAAGPGAGPHVKVFDGVTFQEIASFYAFQGPTPGMTFQQAPYFDSGMFVAAGDVDGDGRADILIGADQGGGSHFKVFHMNVGAGGSLTANEIVSQFAFNVGFNGGVRVAAVDVEGEGQTAVGIAAGPGAGPHVKVFAYNGTGTMGEILSDWAYQDPVTSPNAYFDSGMFLAAGDVDGDGIAELLVGAGKEAGPHAKIFKINGGSLQELDSFFAFDAAFQGGIRMGAADVDRDGSADILIAGGPGITGRFKAFKFVSDHNREQLFEVIGSASYAGGVFIGGAG